MIRTTLLILGALALIVSVTAGPAPAQTSRTTTAKSATKAGAPAKTAPKASKAATPRATHPTAASTAATATSAEAAEIPSSSSVSTTSGTTETLPAGGFPRDMEIKGQAVRVRAGPGTYYYEIAKLNEPVRVKVMAEESGWCGFKPPSSVIALVKKEDIRRGDAAGGIVTAATARVYAKDPSSDRTWAVIDQLPTETKVTIKGEEGPYYAIATPDSALAYVKVEFLKMPTSATAGLNKTTVNGTVPELKKIEEDPETEAYQKAVTKLQAELAKPADKRTFDPQLEAAFGEISTKAKTDYLRAAAEEALATIKTQRDIQGGFKQMAQDRQALEKRLAEIHKESAETEAKHVAETQAVAASDFEGVLKRMTASMAYGYRLEGEDGHYVCLLNGDPEMLNPLLGKKVRVWGDKRFRADMKIQVCDVKRIEKATE
jgi:hypothetical protein